MIVAHFNCPACETPIETPEDSARRGLKCPACGTGFVPEQMDLAEEPIAPPTGNGLKPGPRLPASPRDDARRARDRDQEQARRKAHEEKWRVYNDLKKNADACFGFGMAGGGACFFLVVFGLANDNQPGYFVGAGGCLFAALVLLGFCQALHLRAALEKLNHKE